MSEPQHVSVDYSCFDANARSLPTVPIRGEDEDIRIRIDISIEGQPDHFSQIEFLSAISAFGVECGANVSIDRHDMITGAHESLDPDCLAVGGDEVIRRYVDGDEYVEVMQAPTHDVDYDSEGEQLPELVDPDVHIPSYAEAHGLRNQQGYSFSNGNYKPTLYAPCASTAAREEEDGRILNMLDKKFVEKGCYLDEDEQQLLLAEEEFREGSWDNSMSEYSALPSVCWSGLRRYSANNTYSKRELKNQLDRIQHLVEELPIVNEPQNFGDGTDKEEGMEAGGDGPAKGNEGQ